MIFKYGSYTHANNEVDLVIEKQNKRNDRGREESMLERWTITGELQAASQSALTTAIQNLVTAYDVDGYNAGLFLDDGSTPTAHLLLTNRALGGVKVVSPPSFNVNKPGEYSTFRSYSIVLEAEFPVATEGLLAWADALTFVGGGPRVKFLETIIGPPVKQLVNFQTTFKVSQDGGARGQFTWPPAAPPIWPAAEHRDRRQIQRKAPQRRGNDFAGYEISWHYEFEAAGVLLGNPIAL